MVVGNLGDCQSSPGHRSGIGGRGLIICSQIPCTSPCNPVVAPQDQGGWVVSCCVQEGHSSWCLTLPSLGVSVLMLTKELTNTGEGVLGVWVLLLVFTLGRFLFIT